MNKLIIACCVYSVLIIGGFFAYSFFKDGKDVKVAEGKALMDKIEGDLSKGKGSHDEEYEFNEEAVATFQKIENNVNFLVAGLQEENEPAFTDMFVPEQYSNDMWAYSKDPSQENVNLKFIKALNRNGTLVSARYDTSTMKDYKATREDSAVSLTLVYKDGKEATLKLNLGMMGTEHSNKDNIYYIENSVLDLIKEVEKQTK